MFIKNIECPLEYILKHYGWTYLVFKIWTMGFVFFFRTRFRFCALVGLWTQLWECTRDCYPLHRDHLIITLQLPHWQLVLHLQIGRSKPILTKRQAMDSGPWLASSRAGLSALVVFPVAPGTQPQGEGGLYGEKMLPLIPLQVSQDMQLQLSPLGSSGDQILATLLS